MDLFIVTVVRAGFLKSNVPFLHDKTFKGTESIFLKRIKMDLQSSKRITLTISTTNANDA